MTIAGNDQSLGPVLREVEREGVDGQRDQLLLWAIRNQYEVSPEDSYEYVLGPDELFPGVAVDAAFVTERRDIVSPVYVLIDDSWNALKSRVRNLTTVLGSVTNPEANLAQKNARLRSLFEPALTRNSPDLHRIIMCVCTQQLTPVRQRAIMDSSVDRLTDVNVLDLAFLRALADAESGAVSTMPEVRLDVRSDSVLDLQLPSARGVVLPISARAIAQWPGIEDRSLFDLNVRHALGMNRVRRSLDSALTNPNGAGDFLAYHNGITAVCGSFVQDSEGITVKGLSVVNGAQTVIAIHSNEVSLQEEVRVLLKLVEADPQSAIARNIAIRSNTQNPVTSRNLRALDPIQERIKAEAGSLGYAYLVRPDDKPPTGGQVIRNDDVAQLICSIYVRKPTLAVKRQVLFENPQYREIFPEDLPVSRVIFAHLVRQVVETTADSVPGRYRGAWALTSLTLVYMASEAMRADSSAKKVLEDPAAAIRDPGRLREIIAPFVDAACKVLTDRRNETDEDDEFKVAFKQTRTLYDLGMQAARQHHKTARTARG